MNRAADNIRILAASAVEKAKSGHPGGAMGGADFINVLYSEYLQYDPANPTWVGRDRFFLDPGHMAPMLYGQLCLIGKYSLEELANLRQWGSPTTGHPEFDITRGIENTSGPLGQGHAYAVGAAIAAKFLAAKTGNPTFEKETIYAYISDGGVQEEISQGAARIAGNLGLDNLIMFYDSNDIQLSTETKEVMNEDTAAKYRALGWDVQEINGNDVAQIRAAIEKAKAVKGKPALIIGKCIMGKGALKEDGSSYERNCKTHGAPLGGDAFKNTVRNLGGDPENPFCIFDDVKALYDARAEELGEWAVQTADETGMSMQSAVIATLSDTISYVGGLVIAFLLILIALVAIANVGNLSFRLPNLELLDEIGGAVLGFIKGMFYCVLLCWLLSFLGRVIGRDTLESTTLAQFFLQIKFLTSGLL